MQKQIAAFRGDIEALRGIAVLSILLFHIDEALCPGGFAGVDVFFVISGYLITGQILSQGDCFSFRDFYARRARRLGPALVVTAALSLIAGWSLMSPQDYASLAASALASLGAAANLYFYWAQNYFDGSNLTKPLLHVWSLSVEEQFYFAWPALLVIAARSRALSLSALMAIAGGLSLLASIVAARFDASLGFYLTPFRVFEFAFGGGVWLWRRPLSQALATWMGAAGLVLIAASFVVFGAGSAWPAANALAPSVGAALFIAAGGAGAANRLAANAPLRLVGRTSYSIYLAHWPLIAFYSYWLVTPPTAPAKAGLFVASLIGGALLFALVEQPFRASSRGRPEPLSLSSRLVRRGALILAVLAPAATAVFAIGVAASGGVPQRLAKGRAERPGELSYAGDACNAYYSRCAFGDLSSRRTVYLVGDSHALNWVAGLDELFRRKHVRGVALYNHGCLFLVGVATYQRGTEDKTCRKNVEQAFAQLASDDSPVILGADWMRYQGAVAADGDSSAQAADADFAAFIERRLAMTLRAIGAAHRPVVIVGQSPRLGVDVGRCRSRPGATEAQCAPREPTLIREEAARIDRILASGAKDYGAVAFVDPVGAFCDAARCATGDGAAIWFRDASHLTVDGSRALVSRVGPALESALRLDP
ncbi:MAG: acyltransferase [Rhizobiales bacterium]|nr:acyltransferase [Hyphomicrobiales bacterium]